MMKRILATLALLAFGSGFAFCKPVSGTTARQVAENFYRGTPHNEVHAIVLVYIVE